MTILQDLKTDARLEPGLLQLTLKEQHVLIEGRQARLLRLRRLGRILGLFNLDGDGLGQGDCRAADQLRRHLEPPIEILDARR